MASLALLWSVGPLRQPHLDRHHRAADQRRARHPDLPRTNRAFRNQRTAHTLVRDDRPNFLGQHTTIRRRLRTPRGRGLAQREPSARGLPRHRELRTRLTELALSPVRCEITDSFAGMKCIFPRLPVMRRWTTSSRLGMSRIDLPPGGRTMESEKILGVNGPTSGEKVICRGRDGAAQ